MDPEVMTMQETFQMHQLLLSLPQARTGGAVSSWHHHWLCRGTLEPVKGGVQHPKREERKCECMGRAPPTAVQLIKVKSLNGVSNVGSITRKWNGLLSAMSDADHFQVHFPLDLDVTMKAIFSGACFLMVYLKI
eukprot:bmy_07697T0